MKKLILSAVVLAHFAFAVPTTCVFTSSVFAGSNNCVSTGCYAPWVVDGIGQTHNECVNVSTGCCSCEWYLVECYHWITGARGDGVRAWRGAGELCVDGACVDIN